MPGNSSIEWTDFTWNPVTGCTKITAGCAYCYIARQTPMRIAGRKFVKGDIPLVFHENRIEQPFHWRKPRRVFVNSMSDLFHEDIPEKFIHRIFDVMRLAPEHTFQVLTKRPERMREVVESYYRLTATRNPVGGEQVEYPLPNVWLGVTIENMRAAWRADVLRDTQAAIRFISAEPLLGSLFNDERPKIVESPSGLVLGHVGRQPLDLSDIDWIICGGESGGRHVRPMHPEWAREILEACLARDPRQPMNPWPERPAFFFKQFGAWSPLTSDDQGILPTDVCMSEDGTKYVAGDDYVCFPNESDGTVLRYRGAGPKAGGKLLDGRAWCEMPGRTLIAA